MLTPVAQLHTATRRFAMDAHDRWAAWYAHSGAADRPDSAESRGVFPRYLVHAAMLRAVETLAPEALPPDLPAARDVLWAAAVGAESPMTRHLTGAVERAAMDEERRALAGFIEAVTPEELARMAPLPYRRALGPEEAAARWAPVAAAWGIADGFYWYPLHESSRPDVIAFEAPEFFRDLGEEWLRGVLAARGVGRVLEFREFSEEPGYELDLAAAEFRYTGAEGYWCDAGAEWIVYASHEGSLTLGGGWLVAAAQAAWPDWAAHLWGVGAPGA